MLLLACVKQVHEFSIDVEMPGLTKGFVKITSISDPFTKYLNKLLEEGGGEVSGNCIDLIPKNFC